jgi:hypothetical protein
LAPLPQDGATGSIVFGEACIANWVEGGHAPNLAGTETLLLDKLQTVVQALCELRDLVPFELHRDFTLSKACCTA